MTLQELETQLQALTLAERADAIQILTQTLSSGSQGILKTPDAVGGDACIANTRLPVWMFVSLQHQGATDAELLEAYPHLTAADLVNVWAYADAHPEEIAIALREQESAMQDGQNFVRLATRTHQAILAEEPLQGKLIRVVRPASQKKVI